MAHFLESGLGLNVTSICFVLCLLCLFLLARLAINKWPIWSLICLIILLIIASELVGFSLGLNMGTCLFVVIAYLMFISLLHWHAFRGSAEFRIVKVLWDTRETRGIILSFILITFLFITFKWFGLPGSGESIKINPIPGVGFEISNERAGHSQNLYVISVPAYRIYTLTGITLRPGDTITISASGIVATSSTYDWFGTNLLKLPQSIYRKAETNEISILYTNEIELYSTILRKSLMDEFDRLHDPDWRNPDGSRIYEGVNFGGYTTPSQERIYHSNMLRGDQQYGMLLGCVLPSREAFSLTDTNNVEVITNVLEEQRDGKIFTIGRQRTIQCIGDGDHMILHFPPGEGSSQEDITNDELEGQLVLLVNDVMVTTNLLLNGDLLRAKFSPEYLNLTTNAVFGNSIFNNEGSQFTSFLTELWYLDNQGMFTVTMQVDNN